MRIKSWVFQLAGGLYLIFIFWRARVMYGLLDSLFVAGMIAGLGGVCLIWGVREVIGALRNRHLYIISEGAQIKG